MRKLSLLAVLALAATAAVGCSEEEPFDSDESDVTEVIPETSSEGQALRAMLNDPATTKDVLTKGKITSAVATALLAHRNGPDGILFTADDDAYDTVREVDAIKGIGEATLKKLLGLATSRGYVAAEEAKTRSVIFSPQVASQSHNAEVARVIATAKTSIDIAMYSYSDSGIATALSDAVKRGVKVRFIFETANDDRKLTGTALMNSKSGKLETAGVDVRWVNKIMHHKFMIVDGPRDAAEAAKTATIVSGSGNWSSGAGTIYDENTMFMKAYPELALRLQRDFNLLWDHSTDLVANPAIVSEASTLRITDDMIPLDPGAQIFFTSDNFKVSGTTFSVQARNAVSDELVRAIDGAEERIHIASGHLRSRPVSEAIIRKVTENPEVDVMIYLDGQEYVSDTTNTQQKTDQTACLALATTESKKNACLDKSYLYGRDVEKAGANVRYKYYAYRWDASYAAQMHNKFLIIDDTLYTGSYNLSDNAEHNTFENMFMFRGPEFQDMVELYEAKFQDLWKQGDGLLPGLRTQIDKDATIPIVFPAMSLSWTEVRDLKSLISAECPAVNSAAYRSNAPGHKVCSK